MLPDERMLQIKAGAKARAKALSPELLREEAANAHTAHNDATVGSDARTELALIERAYIDEMIFRGLTV